MRRTVLSGIYRLEALLDLSLAPHRWKSHYMALYPGHFEGVSPSGADIWDTIADSATHRYSETKWRRYGLLLEHSLSELIRRIEQLLTQHAPVIPTALKTAAVRVIRQLEVEQSVYQMIPILKGTTPDGEVDAVRRSIEQDHLTPVRRAPA